LPQLIEEDLVASTHRGGLCLASMPPTQAIDPGANRFASIAIGNFRVSAKKGSTHTLLQYVPADQFRNGLTISVWLHSRRCAELFWILSSRTDCTRSAIPLPSLQLQLSTVSYCSSNRTDCSQSDKIVASPLGRLGASTRRGGLSMLPRLKEEGFAVASTHRGGLLKVASTQRGGLL
jgi:hypothetical protein